MKNRILQISMVIVAAVVLLASVLEMEAQARAGGGRSFGSRGTRSYSRPASPSPSQPQYAPQSQQRPYTPPPYQAPQPAGGGFLRSMAGGVLGGMLGGMLFRGLGFGGGMGGMGGSGIGLFEILLIAGIGYFIYRMVKRKREEAAAYPHGYGQGGYQQEYQAPAQEHVQPYQAAQDDLASGIAHIRQMDASFDEQQFADTAMDVFFKIQGAWMNRDLAPATGLLTDEMRRILQADIDGLVREKRVNRLENIAVRSVEVVEAWQESGQDFVTALIYANLLDYTTDESGTVVAGSKTDPVKFEEYWTFSRPVGNNPWRLSAIEQK